MNTYTIEAYFPVLRGCHERIKAESPEAAMAELKRRVVETDWLADHNHGYDDGDGPNTYAVWDEVMRVELLQETDDPIPARLAALIAAVDEVHAELEARGISGRIFDKLGTEIAKARGEA